MSIYKEKINSLIMKFSVEKKNIVKSLHNTVNRHKIRDNKTKRQL